MHKVFLFAIALAVALALPGLKTAEMADDPCGAGPVPTSLIGALSAERWAGWIARLSGETPVEVGEATTILSTRHTEAMFWGLAPNPSLAYDYVRAQLDQWYPDRQVTEQSFPMSSGYDAKNLILDLPGTTLPNEVVVLSAHLDSTSSNPYYLAPGAEDNASGSAALLEAARLLRAYRFERSLRLIWFSGEEQGLIGSRYYVAHLPAGETIVGDINLDMYGYDADDDHCFELHVGETAASGVVGQCFVATIQANGLNLSYDYLTTQAEGHSDHDSFWKAHLGAVEVLENYGTHSLENGCVGRDDNPYYHTTSDRLEHLNLEAGLEITRAALTTAANLAMPAGMCLNGTIPKATATHQSSGVQLSWTAVPGASSYRLRRSAESCNGGWKLVGETSSLAWNDSTPQPGRTYHYEVEAVGAEGCASLPSTCATVNAPYPVFLPMVGK